MVLSKGCGFSQNNTQSHGGVVLVRYSNYPHTVPPVLVFFNTLDKTKTVLINYIAVVIMKINRTR